MSNPFHSFHIQKGGVPLKKLSKHYRKISKNKSHKFQPLVFQEKEDLVVPMDLLHIPPQSHMCHQQPENYYVYPEQQQPPIQGTLEIVEIHTIPQPSSYEHPSVIDDNLFEEMFQNISTAPRSLKKQLKNSQTLRKKDKTKRKTKKSKK
jgi:hypothetical protein